MYMRLPLLLLFRVYWLRNLTGGQSTTTHHLLFNVGSIPVTFLKPTHLFFLFKGISETGRLLLMVCVKWL